MEAALVVVVIGCVVLVAAVVFRLVFQQPKRPKVQYLSDDQIVQDLLQKLAVDHDDRIDWMSANEDELIQLHHGTGRNLRNIYHMWDSFNPHSFINPEPNPETGLLDHPKFPDCRSQRIIERVWKELHKRYPPLTADVRAYARKKNGLDKKAWPPVEHYGSPRQG